MGTKVMFVYNFDGGVNFCENIFLRIVKRIAKNSCHVALLQCLLALNAVSDVFSPFLGGQCRSSKLTRRTSETHPRWTSLITTSQ